MIWGESTITNIKPVEIEILLAMLQGKSGSEISSFVNKSTRTINRYKKQLLQKLGLKNECQVGVYLVSNLLQQEFNSNDVSFLMLKQALIKGMHT